MGCAAIPLLKLRPAVPVLRRNCGVYRGTYRGAAGVVKRGTVMQMTARSWLASRFIWQAGLPCARFVASRHGDSRPKLLFVLLFVGVFLSRLVFLATR